MKHRGIFVRGLRITVVLAATIAVLTASLAISSAPAGAVMDPGSLPTNASWLQTLNAWRSASHVDPVAENGAWSTGAVNHSRYMVETPDYGHDEDSGGPWATSDGAQAGANGNVAASSSASKTDRSFIELWITAPFHAAGMLDPELATTGFGSYRHTGAQPYASAATLDVLRGRTAGPQGSVVEFPGNGSVLPVAQQSYRGGENPDPLAPCSGYGAAASTGTPLFALLPRATEAGSFSATVTRDGAPVASCAYDSTSYTNQDANAQDLGRAVLASRRQAVVVPRQPLEQGATYAVSASVTYAGDSTPTSFSWFFTAASQPDVSIGNASIVEGQARTRFVRETITLSHAAAGPVSVHYATVPGTATAGSDYSSKSGTVTLATGATSAVIAIPIKGDRVIEPNESFTVRLTDPVGAALRHANGSVSILTDDRTNTQATGIQISIGNAGVVEGDTGTRAVRFALTLSAFSAKPVRVRYATSPGSAGAADFTARSGSVTIPAGETSAIVAVWIKGDVEHERQELFTVQLSGPVNTGIERPVGTGSIINDD